MWLCLVVAGVVALVGGEALRTQVFLVAVVVVVVAQVVELICSLLHHCSDQQRL
jgi:hypothetical protein